MYYVAKHVHACVAGDYCVLLDVRQGEYLCVGHAEAVALGSRIAGWLRIEGEHVAAPETTLQSVDAALRDMAAQGMLTDDPRNGRALDIPVISPATRSVNAAEGRYSIPGPVDVVNFVRACIRTRHDLRSLPLEALVRRIQMRRERRGALPFDLAVAGRKVGIFRKLRPYFPVSGKGQCMFDSLALVEFLACYGLCPQWVFGVRTEPFYAHCWVQQENFLMNEDIDRVRSYAPIMAV